MCNPPEMQCKLIRARFKHVRDESWTERGNYKKIKIKKKLVWVQSKRHT